MRSSSFHAGLISTLAVGLISACAAVPKEEAPARRSWYSVTILQDEVLLPKSPIHDSDGWPTWHVQKQIAGCWYVERDGRYDESVPFRLKARLAPDGTVIESEAENGEAMLLDPMFRELVQSAQQALTDCGPLALPPAEYNAWREIFFSFYPAGRESWLKLRTSSRPRVSIEASDFGDPNFDPEKLAQRMTAAISEHFAPCWRRLFNPSESGHGSVGVQLLVNRDGSVARIELRDPERLANEPSFRLLAEAAVRAVQLCSPIEGLPSNHYESWRKLDLVFTPWEPPGE